MPTPITLTEQENEWIQNVLVWYSQLPVYSESTTELAIYQSVMAKLKAGDTL